MSSSNRTRTGNAPTMTTACFVYQTQHVGGASLPTGARNVTLTNETSVRPTANGGTSLCSRQLALIVRTTLVVSAVFPGITASGGLTKLDVHAEVVQAGPS